MDETIGSLASEIPAHDQLTPRDQLIVDADWAGVIDAYLARGATQPGQARDPLPVDELPTAVQALGQHADTDDTTATLGGFRGFLESQGLLADSEVHAANAHAREVAGHHPLPSLAERLQFRRTQDSYITHYVGTYRFLLPPYTQANRDLDRLAQLSRLVDASDPALAPLNVQLHRRANELLNVISDENYEEPSPPESVSTRIEGDDRLLTGSGIDPAEFRQMVAIAAHSYPSALMAADIAVQLEKRGPYSTDIADMDVGRGTATLTVWPEGLASENAISFAGQRIPQDPKQRLTMVIEGVLDHEFAHLAHKNAPVEWLREWATMLQNGLSLDALSAYTQHAASGQSKNTHKENEQLAEAIQIYRSDPVHLITTIGLKPFMHLQKLLHSYNDDTLTRELSGLQLPLDDERSHELRRVLGADRQSKLRADLENAGYTW